ncbi:MAG TPA: LysR family transcriptional regulator [Vicinamibacterales bacterium]|nr:LysR family transcriptional regulator [Vicinamibacterales bacterium]
MSNIPDLDLKLIYVFEALIKYRNVSRAAEELDISQPSLSQGLAKLRREFGDRLFVRTSEGMMPTTCAAALAEPMLEMANIYRERILLRRQFNPLTSEHVFTIAASDIGELVFIPRLMHALETRAPRVRLSAHRWESGTLLSSLQSGEADVAIGGYPSLEAGIRERRLYQEHYVCLVRGDHPTIRGELTRETFLSGSHILVAAHSAGHIHQRAERLLRQLLDPYSIKATSQSFLLSALLLPQTDCILTVPSQVAVKLSGMLGLQVLAPPIEFEPFDVMVLWHERFHKDPAHQWLRGLIAEIFENYNTI